MMHTSNFLLFSVLTLCAFVSGCSPKSGAPASLPEQDGLYFITPRNGDVVTSPVTVRFGLRGRGVAPAGVNQQNTGHHHLLVDVATPPPAAAPIPEPNTASLLAIAP